MTTDLRLLLSGPERPLIRVEQETSSNNIVVTWDVCRKMSKYYVRVRSPSSAIDDFKEEALDGTFVLETVRPSTKYEFRVYGQSSSGVNGPDAIKEFCSSRFCEIH